MRALFLTIVPLFLIIIVDMMGGGIVLPVFGPLVMDSHVGIFSTATSLATRNFTYAALIGIFFVFQFIAAPILGDISDRFGRKKTLLICLILTSLSFYICAIGIAYKSLLWLVIGRSLNGVTAGTIPIVQAAIVDISAEEDKAKNLALISLALSIGFIIGPVIGGYFSTPQHGYQFNFATPFYIATILGLLNALLLHIGLKEIHPPVKKGRLILLKGLMMFTQAFKDKNIKYISIVYFLLNMSFALYFQYVSLYLVQQFQYSADDIGYFYAFLAVIAAIADTIVIRTLLRFFRESFLVKIMSLQFALGLLVLVFYRTLPMQWILAVPVIIGDGVAYTCLLALYSNSVSLDKQGWVMGVSTSVAAATWVFAGLLLAIMSTLQIHMPFVLASLLALLGTFVSVYFLDKYEKTA